MSSNSLDPKYQEGFYDGKKSVALRETSLNFAIRLADILRDESGADEVRDDAQIFYDFLNGTFQEKSEAEDEHEHEHEHTRTTFDFSSEATESSNLTNTESAEPTSEELVINFFEHLEEIGKIVSVLQRDVFKNLNALIGNAVFPVTDPFSKNG